jgi:hypothetical protein
LCRDNVQRRCACQNIPGNANAIPGSGENRSPSRRNRCSPSARNPIRLHPGIVFTFAPESFSPCPGIRNNRAPGHLRCVDVWKTFNGVVVAVARHLAEAAWWVLTRQEVYREPHGPRQQALSSTHG